MMKRFRSGEINVIVATSIGEEGLDIGHVDLIISYDLMKSPLRTVQRFGRTGRKRAGRCLTLVMEGNEEAEYHRSEWEKNQSQKRLQGLSKEPPWAKDILSARMIPTQIVPTINFVNIGKAAAAATAKSRNPKRKRKASEDAEADEEDAKPGAFAAAESKSDQKLVAAVDAAVFAAQIQREQKQDQARDDLAAELLNSPAFLLSPESRPAAPTASTTVSALFERQHASAAEEQQKLRAERLAKKHKADGAPLPHSFVSRLQSRVCLLSCVFNPVRSHLSVLCLCSRISSCSIPSICVSHCCRQFCGKLQERR